MSYQCGNTGDCPGCSDCLTPEQILARAILSPVFIDDGGLLFAAGQEVDIVLAKIFAEAPDVFRAFVTSLATPVPPGECPKHYAHWNDIADDGRYLSWMWGACGMPNRDDIEDGDEKPLTFKRALAESVAHRNNVLVDGYPELCAKITALRASLDEARRGLARVASMAREEVPRSVPRPIRATERRSCPSRSVCKLGRRGI